MLADKDSIITVPFRAFLSNGTAPDTGLSNDSIRGSANGAAQFTLTNKVSAVSANAGMYAIVTTASETSVLGTLALWYDQGDFPQHIANVEVVNDNPYSMMSNIAVKTYSGVTFGSLATLVAGDYSSSITFGVGLIKAGTYSGVTLGVNNIDKAVGAISGLSFGPIPGDYGSTFTVGVSNIKAAIYSGVTVGTAGGTFSLAPGVYSDVTVQINGIAPATYSGVTVGTAGGTFSLAPGNYSDVTVRVAGPIALTSAVTLAAGTYSDVTIGGVTRVNSSVTIANAEYSGVTVRTSVLSGHTPQTGDNFARLGAPAGASVSADVAAVKVDTAAVKVKTDQMVYTVANRLDATINSAVTLAAGTYSNVTIGGVTRVNSNVTIADADYSGVTVRASNITVATGGIVAASFGAGAIDAVALATDAGQEFADRLLLRNIASGSDGGRSVAEALYALRNRVAIDGSIGTVYQVNDTSSAWTFSVQTVSANSGLVNSIDPG